MGDHRVRIVINGEEYDNLDDVPEELRHLVADRNGDGVPDLVQGGIRLSDLVGGSAQASIEITSEESLLQMSSVEVLEDDGSPTDHPATAEPAPAPSPFDDSPGVEARIVPRAPLVRPEAKRSGGAVKATILVATVAAVAGGAIVYFLMS